MMINEVFSVTRTADDALMVDLDYTDGSGVRSRAEYVYRASDLYGTLTGPLTLWLADNSPDIRPYVPPTPEAVAPEAISRRQFFQVLAEPPYERITKAEALAAVQLGTIPAAFQAFIAVLPAEQQFGATMLLAGADTFEFAHPISVTFGAEQGWTEEQRAQLWRDGFAL
jgi:hypothetical protein